MKDNKIKSLFLITLCLVAFLFVAALVMTLEPMEAIKFNIKLAYLITSIISFFVLIWYFSVDDKNLLFCLLFIAVFVVNIGYFFLATSTVVSEALMANRISYLGAVFLPLIMLIIILNALKIRLPKVVILGLISISVIVFLIAASPGFSTIYYKDVELVFIDGSAKLLKTYGQWHKVYYLYLFSYYLIMIFSALYCLLKNRKKNLKLSFHLLAIVFCNIFVWYLNQLFKFDFEFLSISYILTEFYLLTVYNALDEEIVHDEVSQMVLVNPVNDVTFYDEDNLPDIKSIIKVWPQVAQLTSREIEVFNHLIMDRKRKEIAEKLFVSENTVKKHISNIFTKLNISSKTELLKMISKIDHEHK